MTTVFEGLLVYFVIGLLFTYAMNRWHPANFSSEEDLALFLLWPIFLGATIIFTIGAAGDRQRAAAVQKAKPKE